jgi:predicted dehydrogenase
MRWGIVATGKIAHTTVVDLQAVGGAEVVAVASRAADRADAFAQQYGIPHAHGSYDALLADDDVDIVYIATPHSGHGEVVRAALEAGKHVLCEKSFTPTAAETIELAALAAERKLLLVEAMWTRFNHAIVRLLEELADGAIGEVRSVHAQFGIQFPPDETSRIWRADLAGGALLDLCVYPLSLIHLVLGVPDRVRAVGDIRPDGVDLTESVLLDYADGRLGHALSSITAPFGSHATVGGTEGQVVIDPPFHAPESFRIYRGRSFDPRVLTIKREGNGYVPMFRAIDEAATQGLTEHPLRPMSDTIAVLEIMDEVRRQLAEA